MNITNMITILTKHALPNVISALNWPLCPCPQSNRHEPLGRRTLVLMTTSVRVCWGG